MQTLPHFHRRIADKTANMGAPPVVIVALGDSVTHGLMANEVLDQTAVYHHQLWQMLIRRYPLCVFSVINAGVGGDSAPGGLARLQRDVIRHQPDLVIVGYALNDCGGGAEGLPNFRHAIAEILGHVKRETRGDTILLTPNFMNTRDNDKVAPVHRAANLVDIFIKRQNEGQLAMYAQAVRDAAAQAGVPVADVYAEWEKLARAGKDTTAMLSNGLNHPDAEGHRIPADLLMRIIESA